MDAIFKESLQAKKQQLDEITLALKREFFGIDTAIDSVMQSIQTWFLLPQAITRPVITNLWGLTGVGKTALVRSLVEKLGFLNRFIEVQMDTTNTLSFSSATSICGMLEASPIEEGQPGIVLLDEFQRFRTVDMHGKDVKLERYADVWMLLSDGRFSSDYSFISRLEEQLADDEYSKDSSAYSAAKKVAEAQAKALKVGKTQGDEHGAPTGNGKRATGATGGYKSVFDDPDDDDAEDHSAAQVTVNYRRRFKLTSWEARSFKKLLRLPDAVMEIMEWEPSKLKELSRDYIAKNRNQSIDYTKVLIFVCGNLDEAFKMAESVEDCDTSADVFCEYSKKIGVINIKGALNTRFRPEQIARLGNNHVIYPSLCRVAYEKIIRLTCARYLVEIEKACGIRFDIDEEVYREVYDNSVYPTQGTRPVFTSIHKLFGSPLSDGVLYAFEIGATRLRISLDVDSSSLVFTHNPDQTKAVHIDLDIRARKARYSSDYVSLIAIHEAGHAIAFASLFHSPPREIAVSVASFDGGYNLYDHKAQSKTDLINSIAVSMAGIAAEEIVFGEGLRSSGCRSDIVNATKAASSYVRELGFDGFKTHIAIVNGNLLNEDIDATNAILDNLVKDGLSKASDLLKSHRELLLSLARHLVKVKKVNDREFVAFVGDRIKGMKATDTSDVRGNYAELLLIA